MTINARTATVLLSVVIAIIGGALVVAFWNDDRTIAELCRYGGTVLVASVALTLVFDQKRWFVDEVFPVFRNWQQSGLTQATLNFQDESIDWKKLFKKAPSYVSLYGTQRHGAIVKYSTFESSRNRINHWK